MSRLILFVILPAAVLACASRAPSLSAGPAAPSTLGDRDRCIFGKDRSELRWRVTSSRDSKVRLFVNGVQVDRIEIKPVDSSEIHGKTIELKVFEPYEFTLRLGDWNPLPNAKLSVDLWATIDDRARKQIPNSWCRISPELPP